MYGEMGASQGEDDFEAWAAYRKTQERRREGRKEKKGEVAEREEGKLNRINLRTGKRNRCYFCENGYQLLPRCPY